MQLKNGANEGKFAPSHVLFKAGNDWQKDPRDNDLEPNWLKLSRIMNNESEYMKRRQQRERNYQQKGKLKKNIQSVLEEGMWYVQEGAKCELLMHLPQDNKDFEEAN